MSFQDKIMSEFVAIIPLLTRVLRVLVWSIYNVPDRKYRYKCSVNDSLGVCIPDDAVILSLVRGFMESVEGSFAMKLVFGIVYDAVSCGYTGYIESIMILLGLKHFWLFYKNMQKMNVRSATSV